MALPHLTDRLGKVARALGFAVALLTTGCDLGAGSAATFAPPPRADSPIITPGTPSRVAVELALELGDLERALERELPRRLWEIHRDDMACVPSKRIDLVGIKIKSPTITCDIDGEATRGKVRVSGDGDKLFVTLPVRASVRAHDIAGVLKGETGTGAADVRIALRLDLAPDWTLGGEADLAYRWSRPPGIDIMGRRITFTTEADRELAPLRRQVAKTVLAELRRIPVRAVAEQGWRSAHTVLELNRVNPPVWARVTPQTFRYGGYRIQGRRMLIALGLDAAVETKIGARPEPPKPPPLPPVAPLDARLGRTLLHLPVLADYSAIEPEIDRALAKRARRPFIVRGLGNISAEFGAVTAYGTDGGRIAVGVPFSATSDLALAKQASGTIWLTARPVNAPNSRVISFANVAITGDTSLASEQLLFALANSADFQTTISDALKQNFEDDFAQLLAKIDRAIARRKDGPLAYSVTIKAVNTGVLRAYGQGLYLPVDIDAQIKVEPLRLN